MSNFLAEEMSRHMNFQCFRKCHIQVYSRFDIINSTVTFPVHFHADFWSGNVTFFFLCIYHLIQTVPKNLYYTVYMIIFIITENSMLVSQV